MDVLPTVLQPYWDLIQDSETSHHEDRTGNEINVLVGMSLSSDKRVHCPSPINHSTKLHQDFAEFSCIVIRGMKS